VARVEPAEVGIANLQRRSGLTNLRHRAVSRGGREVRRRPEGGTAFAWTVLLVYG
jgi:hypothetical protein